MLALGALAGAAQAQTISPVIVEYKEKARGKFEVQNDSVLPLNVVLEPRSFSVDEKGNPFFRALDEDIQVKLSAMSFRLAPRQTYTVFYDVTSTRLPAWLTIYAVVTGATTPEGIKLAIELPHTVYLLPKKPLDQESVRLVRAAATADRKAIEAVLENHGAEFDRVLEVEVASPAGKKSYPGFPLFPGQKRLLRLDWDRAEAPQRLVLRFAKFKVEEPVRPAAETP
jgi:hypothetical protein